MKENSKKQRESSVDSMGVQKSLHRADYITDGMAGVGIYLMQAVMGMVVYFYTDKLGLAIGFVSTMLVIPRVLDAVTDVVMGGILDRFKFKNGRYRPWLLWLAVPLGLSILLTFIMPPNMSPVITGIYIVAASLLTQGIFGTGLLISYTALLGARTRSVEERQKLNLLRTIWQLVPSLLGNMLFIPLANALGGDRKAYIIVIIIFSVVCVLTILMTYFFSKELPETEVQEEVKEEKSNSNVVKDLLQLTHNPYWVKISVVTLMIAFVTNLLTAGGVYYTKWILGDDNLTGISGLASIVAMIVGLILIGAVRSKVGATNIMRFSWALAAAGFILRAIFPYNAAFYICAGSLSGFAGVATWSSMLAFINNCSEYNELKFGRAMRGLTNSSNSFIQKISVSLGTVVVGGVMALAHYDSALAVQTEQVKFVLSLLNNIIPAILFIVSLLVFTKFDLEKAYPDIVKQLQNKNE